MTWATIRLDAGDEDLAQWCAAARGDVCWFDSAIGHPQRGQRSLLVLELSPFVRLRGEDAVIYTIDGKVAEQLPARNVWGTLDARLRRDRESHALDGFPAAVVGYLSYEAARFCEPGIARAADVVTPMRWDYVRAAVVLEKGVASLVARGDSATDARDRLDSWRRWLRAHGIEQGRPTARAKEQRSARHAREDRASSEDRAHRTTSERANASRLTPLAELRSAPIGILRREDYERRVLSVLEAIRAGRYFQACLTYPIAFQRPSESLVSSYVTLRARTPADYGGYFRWGDIELASTSPEEFFSIRGDQVRARPMKGTASRAGRSLEEAVRALRESDKDRAENVMITDLLRNDLGRCCQIGTIAVPALCEIEAYETVVQMTSTITGTLSPGTGPFGVLQATFPPGSMTGAPKLEACAHLAELEGMARGLYAGTIGWIGYDERSVFNVVIRSLQAWGDTMRWNTGGGIVLDSKPTAEWAESRTKAAAVLLRDD